MDTVLKLSRWASAFLVVGVVLCSLVTWLPAPARAVGLPAEDTVNEDLNPTAIHTDLIWSDNCAVSNMGNYTALQWIDNPSYGGYEEGNWGWAALGDKKFYSTIPGYLYWHAAAADDGIFGTSTTTVTMSDPVTPHDYYEVQLRIRAAIWDGLPETNLTGQVNVNFVQTIYNNVRVGLYYEDEGTPIQTEYPAWGQFSHFQDAVDGSTMAPFGYNTWTGGNGVNMDAGDSIKFDRINGWLLTPDNGSYYTPLNIAAHTFDENPYHERPWTYDEVCDLKAKVWLTWNPSIFTGILNLDHGLMMGLVQVYLVVLPTTYTPDETAPGSFILRPDGDLVLYNWFRGEDWGNSTDLYDEVNETDWASDQDDSFINTTLGASGNIAMFDLEAPPSWADTTATYALYPWAIYEATELLSNSDIFFTLGAASAGAAYDSETALTIQTYWTNLTFESLLDPSDGQAWSFSDLDDLTVFVTSVLVYGYSDASGSLNVSQLAVLCVPSEYGVYPPEGEPEPTTEPVVDLLDWFMVGGVTALFGIIGFFGMIAAPALAAYSYREGHGGLRALVILFLFEILFVGFLWVGVRAHWA